VGCTPPTFRFRSGARTLSISSVSSVTYLTGTTTTRRYTRPFATRSTLEPNLPRRRSTLIKNSLICIKYNPTPTSSHAALALLAASGAPEARLALMTPTLSAPLCPPDPHPHNNDSTPTTQNSSAPLPCTTPDNLHTHSHFRRPQHCTLPSTRTIPDCTSTPISGR